METEKYTEKLARYTLYAAVFCLIAALCWYFRSVLVYILGAVVISLLARPIMTLLGKISIKGHKMPAWLAAIISQFLLLVVFLCIITMIVPIVSSIVKGISIGSIDNAAAQIAVPDIVLPVHAEMDGIVKMLCDGLAPAGVTGQEHITAYVALHTANVKLHTNILHKRHPFCEN